jgi:uncharacterized membrane protein (UPF0127 family)
MRPLLLKIAVAARFADRGRGLLGRSSLDLDEGLLIVPCSSIHTMFMRFPLDAVFFDRDGVVTKLAVHLRPWRFAWGGRAHACLELASGGAARHGFSLGQKLTCVAHDALVGRGTIDLRHAAAPGTLCSDDS